ncbi:MAG TPA: serine hydrolase [Candidatus Saccharimonadales bacterium]|nr:serine hydrolase [Candidatus Saccharimonadales bacterium]
MSVRKGRVIADVVTVALVAVLGFGALNASKPVQGVKPQISTLATRSASENITWPAQGYAAVGATGYGVLAAKGDQTPRPIASISKLITALTVLKQQPLKLGEPGSTYTITDADVARFNDYLAKGGTVVPVTVGEQITKYQTLQAMLLPSANNMADSLAVWTFGSMEDYHVAANAVVRQLGMTHTTVGGDASGLSPATISTPADLVVLGEAVLAQPVLAQIVGQTTADLPVAGTVKNSNALLGSNGVVGIKTGTSDEAGGCLLSAAQYELATGKTITVIAAIIGAPNRPTAFAATPQLLSSTSDNFTYDTPVRAGEIIGTYNLPWGGSVTAVAKKTVSFVRWNGVALSTTAKLDKINRGLQKGAKLGTVTIKSGDTTYATDVITKDAAPTPPIWWRAVRH